MPAPQASPLKVIVKATFMSKGIKVPTNWQQPNGDPGSAYDDAFKPEEKVAMPASPPLFIPATMNKVHVDTQKQLVNDFTKFIDKTCEAVCMAWAQWQSLAQMQGVIVNAVTASAGSVLYAGPPLSTLIIANGMVDTPNYLKYTTAVGNAFEKAWQAYTMSIKIPGLPFYPVFAMVPSPVAPPTPNVPFPVAVLAANPMTMQTNSLKGMMIAELGDPMAPFHAELFEAIATGINAMFVIWQTSTQLMNIIGTGPIPTFAPPYVPGGPVVAGTGMGAPGCFV